MKRAYHRFNRERRLYSKNVPGVVRAKNYEKSGSETKEWRGEFFAENVFEIAIRY